jgi:DNA primase
MRIPDEKIDEVRNASDVVDVISSFVTLKKRGKNYLGLCPFHQEKTPSFNVSPERQMYHCFGCGVGGNVFTFVMEHEKVSFVEAVRTLAERAGITLPQPGTQDSAQATENEELFAACRTAARFFYDNMMNTTEGKLALEYFHHRGFTDDTVRKFGLGYSMNAWDSLVRFVEKEKLSIATFEKAGLILRREEGSGYYDRFRGRAMFPIFSPSGRVIAFGARKLREDDQLGKYINSPETPIFNKSRVLYGLFQSKEAIREKDDAILVEGYADLISVSQAGIKNIVASSGTALTEEQIRLLGRYTKNITFVYDADSAGSKAMIRGVDLIIENGLEVKVVELPADEDPDSFVRKQGGEAFQGLLDRAVTFLEFKANLYRAEGMFESPDKKTKAIRSIVQTIAKMKDELKRNLYIQTLSEKYGIYESVLFRELEHLVQQERPVRPSGNPERKPDLTAPSPAPEAPAPPSTVPPPERDLLKVMLEHGTDIAQSVFSHVGTDVFTHPLARSVAEFIRSALEAGMNPDADFILTNSEDPALKHFVAEILFNRYDIAKGWEKMGSAPEPADPWRIAEDCIVRLRLREIDSLLAETQRLFKEAEARGLDVRDLRERARSLQEEKSTLKKHGLQGKEKQK